MKNNLQYSVIGLLVAIVLLSSCSVQKRHYRPGLHFNSEVKVPKPEIKKHEAAVETTADVTPVVTPIEDATAEVETPTVSTPAVVTTPDTKKTIAYNAVRQTTVKPVTQLGDKYIATNIISKKALKGQSPRGMAANKLLTIILCIFLGWVGVHRFYLGYNLSAILYIALFLASAFLWGFLGPIGWICGTLLIVFIILDLIYLILDMPLLFQE